MLYVVEAKLEVVELDFDGEGVLYVVEANLEVVELDFDGEGVWTVGPGGRPGCALFLRVFALGGSPTFLESLRSVPALLRRGWRLFRVSWRGWTEKSTSSPTV